LITNLVSKKIIWFFQIHNIYLHIKPTYEYHFPDQWGYW